MYISSLFLISSLFNFQGSFRASNLIYPKVLFLFPTPLFAECLAIISFTFPFVNTFLKVFLNFVHFFQKTLLFLPFLYVLNNRKTRTRICARAFYYFQKTPFESRDALEVVDVLIVALLEPTYTT